MTIPKHIIELAIEKFYKRYDSDLYDLLIATSPTDTFWEDVLKNV